jgi:hypothetical protein
METLASGNASFTPHLALIAFGSEADDPTGVHAIHELAHALTFAQSDFYAEFAAKRLMGQKVQIGTFAPLLETVPEVLGRLGERHAPGTVPDKELAAALFNCVRDYVEIFAPAWTAVGKDPRRASSAAGDAAGITGLRLFKRTLVLAIVDFALQRALHDDDHGSAARTIYDLADGLGGALKHLDLPTREMTLKDHVSTLLGSPKNQFATMFSDQFRLLEILDHVDSPSFTENMLLLPAVVRIELFLEHHNNYLTYDYFGHTSLDFNQRMDQYVLSKLRNPNTIHTLRKKLEELRLSFAPGFGTTPIMIHPSQQTDPRANSYYTIFGLTEFIARLPKFLELLFEEGPAAIFGRPDVTDSLEEIKRRSADGVQAAMKNIAAKLNRPDLSNIDDVIELEEGKDSQFGDVIYLKAK